MSSKYWASFPSVLEVILAGLPLVFWEWRTAAEIPIPCWPRFCLQKLHPLYA